MGWEGGYGRYIRIRHANGYQTAYGHMSAFARNMAEGKRVRQGQIIGYVGSTGLSTGAHLHYEIIVNGRHVDPMKYPAAARPRARRPDACELRAGARAARQHDHPRRPDARRTRRAWRRPRRVDCRDLSARRRYFFFSPFFWPSSTFRSGLDLGSPR